MVYVTWLTLSFETGQSCPEHQCPCPSTFDLNEKLPPFWTFPPDIKKILSIFLQFRTIDWKVVHVLLSLFWQTWDTLAFELLLFYRGGPYMNTPSWSNLDWYEWLVQSLNFKLWFKRLTHISPNGKARDSLISVSIRSVRRIHIRHLLIITSIIPVNTQLVLNESWYFNK